MSAAPRPNLWDHLRVVWLLLTTPLGAVCVALWLPFSPLLTPLMKRRLRRRIEGLEVREPDEPPAPDPATWAGRTIFVSAGEASGDRLAARVVAAIKARCPDVRVRGYGGHETEAAGAELDRDLTDNAVMGIVAVAKTMGFWWKICVETQAIFREDPPDVFFSVDFPGLNGRLALWATKRGIPTVHLVPPAVWAYAPWRLPRWRRSVKRMLTVFPFEPPLFEGSGIECVHVGHPLFEAPLPPPRTPERWPGEEACVVELLPGSRSQEIRRHAPVLLDAARLVQARLPRASFVVRLAHERHRALFEETLQGAPARPDDVEVVVKDLAGSRDRPILGALATSGTVTAELGTSLVPHCLFYRLSPLMWVVAHSGITAPWFGLVNLIAGETVAPERLLIRKRGEKTARDFLRVAGTADAWSKTREVLQERVRGPIAVEGVADRAARAVLDI